MLQGVAGADVRAVHRARVATRRLRELLPVLPGGGTAVAKLGRRLRVVTRQLGPLRELDVMALLADELRETGRDAVALDAIAESVDRDRVVARQPVTGRRAATERARVARRLDELADQLEHHKHSASGEAALRRWGWAVHARVVARADRLRRAMLAAGSVYLPERLHAVRIALKKLRYALELLVEIGGASQSDLQRLKEKQDTLGRMHDLQMLIERARRLQASSDPESMVVPALEALVDSLEDECRRLHARYIGDRPALDALAAKLSGRSRDAGGRPARASRRAFG